MAENNAGNLSQRALRALIPALSYGAAFAKAQSRKWSSDDPEGNIICSIAENKLTADMLHDKLVAVQRDVPVTTLSYPAGFRGSPEARQAMAHMMGRTFMQGVEVDPENLAILTGAGAVLDLLFWCLAGKGQGVMLPLPIYPAFINDMEVRSGAHPVLFDMNEERDIRQQLSDTAAASEAAGNPVRIMVLAHPNNPMGIVYKRETVLEILKWCLDNNIHFISDEIYALSVWGDSGPEFVSAEVIAQQEKAEGRFTQQQVERLPILLHVVCGMSKDFCASGLRVGVLHTRNSSLITAVDNLSYFHTCSTPTLWTLSKILTDDSFIDQFLAENRKRMKEAYQGLEKALCAAGIPHIKASAAMFCWIDLRQGLEANTWDAERKLWNELVDVGVLVTPGEACKASEPGYFRVCWAWVPPEALPVAAQRIRKLLDSKIQTSA